MTRMEEIQFRHKRSEKILGQYEALLGGLTLIHREYELEDLTGLERALEPLNEYLESTLEDLDYYADEHDPESGIDTSWLRRLVEEVRDI